MKGSSRLARTAAAPVAVLGGLLVLTGLGATLAAAFPVHVVPGDPGACRTCHGPLASGTVAGAPSGNQLCYSCHTDAQGPLFNRALFEQSAHGPLWSARSRTPLARGIQDAGRRGLCVNCHDPHEQGPGRALTRLGTAQDSTALCTSCHLDTQAYGSFSGPRVYGESAHGNPLSGVTRVPSGVATGDCLNCHDPHGQGYPKLLKGPRSGEFCLAAGCHESGAFGTLWPGKAAYQVAGGVHRQPPALPKPGVRRTYPRRDLPAGFCVNCHNPHGALDPRTGRVTPGLTNAARAELCYQCHTELRFTFARPSHHPVDEPGSDLTCTSCHNPHLVGWSGRVTDPDRPTAVMVNRDEFCLRCHDGSFGLATDLRAKLATGEHPGGSCLGCHEPHGSSRPHLQR